MRYKHLCKRVLPGEPGVSSLGQLLNRLDKDNDCDNCVVSTSIRYQNSNAEDVRNGDVMAIDMRKSEANHMDAAETECFV